MRMATTPIRCAPTRCSSWRSIACPRARNCVRNRPFRGWKTCLTDGRCCASGGRWSSSIAARSEQFQSASSSISTIRSTGCTAASSYACSTPITTITASSRFLCFTASGVKIRSFVRRLVGAIRGHWPKVEILLRADSHYAAPEVFDWCRANRVDWLFGLAPNVALRRPVTALEKSTSQRFKEPAPAKAGVAPNRGKVRRFMQFYDAAESWSRVERIIARVEAGPEGTDTRFIVTNLEGGRAKHIYERLYCARGQAENHIKAWKNHLAADRTSCHTAEANQFRLFLHAGAYWLLWSMRRATPKRSTWRVMQFDTLRLRLIKIAARVVELKTQLKIHLPSSAPDQAIFALLLARLPRLLPCEPGRLPPKLVPSPSTPSAYPIPTPTSPPQRQRSPMP